MWQSGYEKRSKRGRSRTVAIGAERRFLAPNERLSRDQKVERIVALAQEGRFAPQLYPVAAVIGFGPDDLLRLPPEVAAGIAEAQERLEAGPPKLRRNLMSLVESMGTYALLREHPADLLVVLRTKAAQAGMLSYDRSIRCNEEAAGEALGWASSAVTGVEAQRAINAGSRAMDMVMRADLTRVKLLVETAKAEKAGVPAEALTDSERRGRRINDRLMSYWTSQLDPSRPKVAIPDDEPAEAALASNPNTSPCTVSGSPDEDPDRTPLLSAQRGERPEGAEGGEPQSESLPVVTSTATEEGDQTPQPDLSRLRPSGALSPLGGEKNENAALTSNRNTTPYTVSPRPGAEENFLPPLEGEKTGGALAPDWKSTPYTVSDTPLLSAQRGERRAAAEGGGHQSRSRLDPIDEDDVGSATANANLPLPLAERQVEAAERLRALDSASAADDPADSWEAEVLAMAVKMGEASASIVARFVELASSVPVFPDPGTANRPRPPMHAYLERLSPRGWPRVTATGSSSISLMGAP